MATFRQSTPAFNRQISGSLRFARNGNKYQGLYPLHESRFVVDGAANNFKLERACL
jgi:hypothetical protein